jgi:cob(I)alamin adenosyltransferase
MGRRTSAKITTKTGDAGLTGVLGPERLPKEDPRIEGLGAVDEATSALGLARAWCDDPFMYEVLVHVQRDLYRLMAELATTTTRADAIGVRLGDDDVAWLERTQEGLLVSVEIPPRFILPGDTRAGATLDFARATVRRAERAVSRLFHTGGLADGVALRYLNRLSDLVFVLARVAEAGAGGSTLAREPERESTAGHADLSCRQSGGAFPAGAVKRS